MREKAKRTRRQFSPQEREDHVQGWQNSGLSASVYGGQVGIPAGYLIRWGHKSRALQGPAAPAFRELSLDDGDGALTQSLMSATAPQSHGPLLDLVFPSGLRLVAHRQVEAAWLKAVIQAVGEVQP